MNIIDNFGCPEVTREKTLDELRNNKNKVKRMVPIFYDNDNINCEVIDVDIRIPVYRMTNVRTKNMQKEWVKKHPELDKDIFTKDPYSTVAQKEQHKVLLNFVNGQGLFKLFKKEMAKQTEPIICSSNGIVVNGNRRLCCWRELYYKEPEKYKNFRKVEVVVLPDSDEELMRELENQLQTKKNYKDPYVWHTEAADDYEQYEKCHSYEKIAIDKGLSKSDWKVIKERIDCYKEAEKYLESTGHEDEWSRVDDKEYAFKQIVASKKKIEKERNQGDKDLFVAVTNALLTEPVKGDRLWKKIPDIKDHFDDVAKSLGQEFETNSISDIEGLELLGGEEIGDMNGAKSAQLASVLREKNDNKKIVEVVDKVLKFHEDIQDELDKQKFVFNKVSSAASNLNNACEHMKTGKMIKDGVKEQIEQIRNACDVLMRWVEE